MLGHELLQRAELTILVVAGDLPFLEQFLRLLGVRFVTGELALLGPKLDRQAVDLALQIVGILSQPVYFTQYSSRTCHHTLLRVIGRSRRGTWVTIPIVTFISQDWDPNLRHAAND